jgi:hypothetical protein|tara:strand:- start:9204 stop:9695 length:492 start_codon:yes stop_codon:yes gene_type:complete
MSRLRYSQELADKVIEGLKKGHTKANVAKMIGLHEDTIRKWQSKDRSGDAHYEGFDARVRAAEESAQGNLIDCITIHSQDDWRAAAWLLERRWDDFKLKARTSAEAQKQIDELSIEKAKAELEYTEAKTKSLNRGSLSPEQILELLNHAREHAKQEAAENAIN